ncbi:MAG: phage head closure protein [Tannerellaceae bacterium]|jgi:SPP1 family predicted phage head-tail adaptor|nr:phage head closure protein [Tannerellaceae bacterium]
MRAGLLRERIDIEGLVSTSDAFTTKNGYQVIYYNVPASVTHLRGGKSVEADEVVTEYTVKFIVRYHFRNTLDVAQRILYGGKKYEILDINPLRSMQQVEITARIIEE